MRNAFIKELVALAEADTRVMLLTGDLGFMVVEEFAATHPDRFVNVGVAEANMIALAAGAAKVGMIPFCYSIATFASMRGYEQLRNGGVLHRLPVRVVGIGGGYGYGHAGATHHALEDLAIMRPQPGLTVLAPGDDAQAVSALRATYDLAGPVYYRLGKDRTSVPGLDGRFTLGRLELLGAGADILLITTSGMTATVAEVARRLEGAGIAATVAVAATIAPAPVDDLRELLARFRCAVTVEDHYVAGGLGSLVAEVIADHGLGTRLIRRGVDMPLGGRSGSEQFMRDAAGLGIESLVRLAVSERAAAGVG